MKKCVCYISVYFQLGFDFTVKEFSDYVGISRTAVYDIISGKAMPRVNVAKKICEFFDKIDNQYDGFWTVDDLWRWL